MAGRTRLHRPSRRRKIYRLILHHSGQGIPDRTQINRLEYKHLKKKEEEFGSVELYIQFLIECAMIREKENMD